MRRIFLLIIIFVGITKLPAQWTQTDAPFGCDISAITLHGDDVFIGIYGEGIFHSLDYGKNWNRIDHYAFPSDIIFTDSLLFAGVRNNGVYTYSFINGKWVITNISLGGKYIYSISLIDSILFAGAESEVLRSLDKGKSWESITDGVPQGSFSNAFAGSGENIFTGGSFSWIGRSTNYGVSWTTVNTGFPPEFVTAMAVLDNDVFVGTTASGVFRSTNNGENWNVVNTGLENLSINTLVVKDSLILAGTEGGVFISTNKGAAWNSIQKNLPGERIQVLATQGTDIVAGTSLTGIFLFVENEVPWKSLNNGLPHGTVTSFANARTSLYAAGNRSGLFRSTNKGKNWSLSGMAMGAWSVIEVSAIAANDTILYFGTPEYGIHGMREYQNGGESWSMNNNIPKSPVISLMYYGNKLLVSTDSGVARAAIPQNYWDPVFWNTINTGLTDSIANMLITVPESGGKYNIFAGTNSGVFLSTNDGDLWNPASNGLTNLKILSFTYTKDASNKITLFAGTEDGGVFRTTDNGSSWVSASSGLEGKYVRALTSYKNKSNVNYLIAGTELGVFASANNGNTWNNIGSGLVDLNIYSLAAYDSNLFAGTYSEGIWRKPLSEIVLDVRVTFSRLPKEFILEQNYPNPFNPVTTIAYQLPYRTHVVITVFDLLGREVKVLLNEEKFPGNYSIQFDASDLSTGIYFYSLRANGFTGAKKMLIVK